MAIHDLPTPTDSKPGLRSYREAASFLVENERLSRGGESTTCPLEPCEPKSSPRPCGSPPRFRPSSSRCRTRTPSPPQQHPSSSSSSSRGESKAPRSVSPGGTPATSAGAALRRRDDGQEGQPAPSPRLRVQWANSLVESVRTRPRTLRKDVSSLFYSRADEKRFRREAERAREVEDEWCEALEEDSLTSLDDDLNESSEHKPLWSPQREKRDYAISKAVVVFGNATRTYGGGVAAPCAIEAALEVQAGPSSFSFDDAAFWNGQLTWS